MHFYRRLSSAPQKVVGEISGVENLESLLLAPRGCETLCTRTLFVERSACMHACTTVTLLPTGQSVAPNEGSKLHQGNVLFKAAPVIIDAL